MSPEEQDAERRALDNVQRNLPALAEQYRQAFGDEISTDNAREIVSPEYAESREARTRWSAATQKPAGALSDYLFDQALQRVDPDKPRIVVMTSGGTGAGKTTALRANPDRTGAQFVYDSNLGSKKSSVRKIEATIGAGNQVRIIHVMRDPVEALTEGVLPRAMEEGRVVGLDAHARMYRDAAENLRYLSRRYASDPRVQFAVIDNRGASAHVVPLDVATKTHYSTSDLQPKLQAALEREYAQGRISERVYRATLGASARRATGSVPDDSGSGGSQAGGGGNAPPATLRDARGVPGAES